MKQFIFPAVFFKDGDSVAVVFPDLNITTEGDSVEEAYLFAKDYLRVYCNYAIKFDLDIERPSKYEFVVDKFPTRTVMLIDALI